jgi:hypothetical protein
MRLLFLIYLCKWLINYSKLNKSWAHIMLINYTILCLLLTNIDVRIVIILYTFLHIVLVCYKLIIFIFYYFIFLVTDLIALFILFIFELILFFICYLIILIYNINYNSNLKAYTLKDIIITKLNYITFTDFINFISLSYLVIISFCYINVFGYSNELIEFDNSFNLAFFGTLQTFNKVYRMFKFIRNEVGKNQTYVWFFPQENKINVR